MGKRMSAEVISPVVPLPEEVLEFAREGGLEVTIGQNLHGALILCNQNVLVRRVIEIGIAVYIIVVSTVSIRIVCVIRCS